MFEFSRPLWLAALILIPLYLYYEFKIRDKSRTRLPFSRFSLIQRIKKGTSLWKHIYPCLRTLLLLTLILAIAGPRFGRGVEEIQGQGVDIVIALDVSGSMQAVDFMPENRLSAAKKVADEFIDQRKNDRIGLVVFSEYALTKCPITHDHTALRQILDQVTVNQDASATAIGMGLSSAVARLRNSTSQSKVIILITDGVNNTGEIDPISAAELAAAFNIKVYPVGVGSEGLVDFPIPDPIFGVRYQKVKIDMDMPTMNKIAMTTGTGEAALATDAQQLKRVLDNIDKLEKSRYTVKVNYDYRESFAFFLWLALLLLTAELVLKLVLVKILPE